MRFLGRGNAPFHIPGFRAMRDVARHALARPNFRRLALGLAGAVGALALCAAAAHATGTKFYSQGSLAADSLASWNSERDGSGVPPSSFADADSFVVQSGHLLTTRAPWLLNLGSIWIEAGGTLDAAEPIALDASATFRVDASGTYIHENSAAFATTLFQSANVELAPGSNFVIRNSDTTGPNGITFGNLTLDLQSNPGEVVTFGGATHVAGDLLLSAGTLALDAGDGGLQLDGNWTRTGGGFSANGRTVVFDGSADQTVTSAGAAMSWIEVSKAAGRLILADDLAVADSLQLTQGLVETGANRLSLGANGRVSRGSGYVVGRLEKSVAAGVSGQSFEIGDDSQYTPVLVSGTGAGFAAPFRLEAATAAGDRTGLAASGIDPSRSVNRTWTLTSSDYSGGTYDLTLDFAAADLDAGAVPAGLVVRKNSGGVWTAAAVAERQPTRIRATGLSGFSDFSIGEQAIDHYAVSATSPQDRGATFSTAVTALDALDLPVSADTTTAVTMSSNGAVEYDADGNTVFGDSVKALSNGSLTIAARDTVAQTVTLTATDGNGKTGSRAGLVFLAPLEIATPSLPGAVAGHAYSQTLSAAGGLAPYSWSLDSGALPAGMSLSAAGGITGTATLAGSSGFTVRVSDAASHSATRPLSISVSADTAATLVFQVQPGNAQVNAALTPAVEVKATDAFSNPVSGATVSLSLSGTGVLGGYSPVATDGSGLASFPTLTVSLPGTKHLLAHTGALTPVASDSFQIGCPVIAVSPDSLPSGTRFESYSTTIGASGGQSPYGYAVSAGALPNGLTLSAAGLLSGTPTSSGVFNFSVTATDTAGCTGSRAYSLAIQSGCPAIAVLPATLPDGSLTVAYSQSLSASAGHPPIGFAKTSGTLPNGLTLSAAGLLSGTPTVANTFSFTVTATDSLGCTGSRAYALVVHAIPAAVANLAAQQTLSGNDNDGTVKIQITFTMPPGATNAEVYRAGFGHYPQYDDAGGSVPAVPSYPPSTPWSLTGVTASGQFDEPATRDFYYYVVFVKNAGGGRSAVSNRSAGALNYHLGDVSNGLVAGAGNNHVSDEDISLLGAHYGITEPAISAAGVAYLDVGPTTDFQPTSRPFTDHRIDFEDLIVFATNYQAVSGPSLVAKAASLSAAVASPGAVASTPATDEFQIEAPSQVEAGAEFGASLNLAASGRMQGFSARLSWNPAVVTPQAIASGPFVESQGGLVLSPQPGTVDAALLGARDRGFSGEGTVATVRFRALRAGDPEIRVAEVVARDRRNQPVETGRSTAAVVRPARTELMGARPNPVRGPAVLEYSLATSSRVELEIFGVDGRRVRTVVKGDREPGIYREAWDGRDEGGRVVAPGVYYVHLVAGGRRFVRTLVSIR